MKFIKRTDLRVGNWVQDENGYYQIEAEHLDEDYFNTLQCWGIGTTDVVLKQLGFLTSKIPPLPPSFTETTEYSLDGLELSTSQSMHWRWHGGYAICDIDYVHQVQNLYSILNNGKELEFKHGEN